MRNYLITGIAGYIGGLLTRKIVENNDGKVFGTDIKEPYVKDIVTFYEADINDKEKLAEIIKNKGIDTIIHLAFYSAPEGNEQDAYRVNVDGTKTVLTVAKENNIKRLVVPTSTAAYGSHPDNPVPLTEESPLRGNEFYYYSYHKRIQENLYKDFMEKHPNIKVIILRPCALLGPHINNQTGVLLNSAVLLNPTNNRNTKVQFIHEDDAVEAFFLAAKSDVTGVFNIASEGITTIPEIAKIAGKKIFHLPYGVLYLLAVLAKKLGLTPVGGKSLKFSLNPIVADGSKFNRTFNFTPKYDTVETVKEYFKSIIK